MKPFAFFPAMFRFIKAKRWDFLAFCVFLGIICGVYSLYRLPWGPAVYTALLLTAAELLFILIKARRHWNRLKRLEKLMECANAKAGVIPMLDAMVQEKSDFDSLELYYISLVRQLESQRVEAVSWAEQKSLASRNYYTLWSHQAKTPLAALRLLLKEDPLDHNALEQELFKAEQYVDMALQFERLDSRDLEFESIPLKHMVTQTVKRMAPLFIHKRIGLELGELDGLVLTDEKWFCFVLEQVLTNAVKYTRQGSVSVSGVDGRVIIKDTGLGIRPEDIPRLFECGFTGYNGRADPTKRATGVGLYLCKKTMDMLGHQISIESKVGQGTTVILDVRRGRLEIE